jgi:hypothetical protein
MADLWNLSVKIKIRLFSYKSEPFQPNEFEVAATERSTSEVYCTGVAIKWRERKANWMNIIKSSTLKTVSYCCSKLKKLGTDGGIKNLELRNEHTSLTGGINRRRYFEWFRLE